MLCAKDRARWFIIVHRRPAVNISGLVVTGCGPGDGTNGMKDIGIGHAGVHAGKRDIGRIHHVVHAGYLVTGNVFKKFTQSKKNRRNEIIRKEHRRFH